MGKAAITSVLTCAANNVPLVRWQEAVLAHFGIESANQLITACSGLDPSLAPAVADSERKKRIAACTRIVVGAADKDEEARSVVRSVAAQVVDVLQPLVDRLEGTGVLVVAGGLGQVDVFWKEVEALMQVKGWRWEAVVKMSDPGLSGLLALMGRAS
jgi:N-acetylglucosamine kinase-like BadF-type ATPase